MKLLNRHRELAPWALLLAALAVILVVVGRGPFLFSLSAQGLLLLPLLWLSCSKRGALRLGTTTPLPFGRWLLLGSLAGISMVLLYQGLFFIVTQALPIGIPASAATPTTASWQALVVRWGGFPWLLALLLSVALSTCGWVKKLPGRLSSLLQPVFRQGPDGAVSLLADFWVRSTAGLALTTALASAILALWLIFMHAINIPLSVGLRFSSLLILTFFMFFPSSPYVTKALRWLLHRRTPYWLILLLFVPALSILLLLAQLISAAIASAYPGWNQDATQFPALNWQQLWLVFSALWWLSWLPLFSSWLAVLSQGMTLRRMIGGGLVMTLVCSALLWLLLQPALLQPWIAYGSIAIGLAIILSIFVRQPYFVYLIRGTLPKSTHEKQRSLFLPLRTLFQNTSLTVVFYLLAGIYLLTVFSAVIVIPFLVLAVLGLLFLRN